MHSLFREDLRSQSLPYRDRKFIERCDRGNKCDTRRPSDSKIELFSSSVVRNAPSPVRQARRAFYMGYCFCGARTQESFGQRLGYERARANSRLGITFPMEPDGNNM